MPLFFGRFEAGAATGLLLAGLSKPLLDFPPVTVEGAQLRLGGGKGIATHRQLLLGAGDKGEQRLATLGDAARQGSFNALQFSRQVLRGMALEAPKGRNARGFWTDMLSGAGAPFQRPTIELALAMHDERNVSKDSGAVRKPSAEAAPEAGGTITSRTPSARATPAAKAGPAPPKPTIA